MSHMHSISTMRKSVTAHALAGLAFVGVGLIAAAPAAAQRAPSPAARSWYGSYSYKEAIPRGFGRDTMTAFIDTTLTINNRGCRIDAQGLQTDEHIRCSARVNGQHLVISFLSYADGSVVNEYGVRRYRPGQALITLQRTDRGLITHWQGYTRSDGRVERGRYFRKIR